MTTRYTQAMDELQFTPEQLDSMTQAIVAAAEESHDALETPTERRPRKARKITKRLVATLLAATLALSAGGLALGAGIAGVTVEEFAAHLLNADTQASSELVESIGTPIGISSTKDGVTVTLDSIIGDDYSAYLLFTVEREDDSELGYDYGPISNEPTCNFEMIDVGVEGITAGGGSLGLLDIDPSDNALQFVVSYDSHAFEPIKGKTMYVMLKNFTTSHYVPNETSEGTWWTEVLARGYWYYEIPLDYDTQTVSLELEQPVSRAGIDATVSLLTVTPFGVSLKYDIAAIDTDDEPWTLAVMAQQRDFIDMPITATLEDGTVVSFTRQSATGSGATRTEDGWVFGSGSIFALADQLIDLDAVVSVTLDGIEIPVA